MISGVYFSVFLRCSKTCAKTGSTAEESVERCFGLIITSVPICFATFEILVSFVETIVLLTKLEFKQAEAV